MAQRRRRIIWISVVALLALVVGFWFTSGPPGIVDLVGYEEVEPGVIEVTLICHNAVDGHFTMAFGPSVVIFATGSDPDRFSFGRDDCLSSDRIDLAEPVGDRRLVDGFDFSTVDPLP
jgi:hypothetical protein